MICTRNATEGGTEMKIIGTLRSGEAIPDELARANLMLIADPLIEAVIKPEASDPKKAQP
jgi:hypothetical protein